MESEKDDVAIAGEIDEGMTMKTEDRPGSSKGCE